MTRLLALLLLLVPAAAAAQADPPPRDTIVIGRTEPADTILLEEDADRAAADTAPRRPSRWGAPFAVEARGRAVARRSRGEVVWVDRTPRDSAAALAADSVQPAPVDSAEGQAESRPDTAPRRTPPDSTRRPAPARRDSAAPAAGRPRTHTVTAGETLFGIARRYGVTTAQLRVLNPSADAEELEVGTVLRLPATARATGAGPRPAAPARPAPAARRTHTVARGETLFGIARRYNVTVDAIMRANRMERDQVQVGQRLVIPPSETR